MRIGEVAAATGVSHRSLRHYERAGLLSVEREANGYRVYPETVVRRVRNIKYLLEAGLTLEDVQVFLPCLDGDVASAEPVEPGLRVARDRLAVLDDRIAAQRRVRDRLAAALAEAERVQLLTAERVQLLTINARTVSATWSPLGPTWSPPGRAYSPLGPRRSVNSRTFRHISGVFGVLTGTKWIFGPPRRGPSGFVLAPGTWWRRWLVACGVGVTTRFGEDQLGCGCVLVRLLECSQVRGRRI